MFSKSEVTRYSRHLILPEVGQEGQQRLKQAKVLVVGSGGLGSPVSLYLAAAGVGRIGLVDFDTIDLSNLQRQILYTTQDVGHSKVQTAARKLADLNGDIEIVPHETKLSAENALGIIRPYDIVIDGTDNFTTRYLVNDACVMLRKPNVYGSIFRFEGQVSLFDPPAGPCYRCLFPQAPPPEAVPNCAEGGVLGVLAGTIGVLQATEAVKWILSIGETLSGRLLLYNALDMYFDVLKIKRNEDCPVCGEKPSITELREESFSCATDEKGSHTDNVSVSQDTDISARSLKELLDGRSEIQLVDVRNPPEFAICNLPGATLIPLNELQDRLGELDRQKPLVVYCKSGVRSNKAAATLRSAGFNDVRHLTGGILQWAKDVDPSLPSY